MSNFSERIMPVAAMCANFDYLIRLFFHKWIVLECNSRHFTLQVLPFSKCFGNSIIFESCFLSSGLYLFIPMTIFLMWAQIFPMVSLLWLLMVCLFHLDWFLPTRISKLLTLWQTQDFLQEQLYFSQCFYIMEINLPLKFGWEVCGAAASEDLASFLLPIQLKWRVCYLQLLLCEIPSLERSQGTLADLRVKNLIWKDNENKSFFGF